LKREIRREPAGVTLNGLIERRSRHTVQASQVFVQKDPLPAHKPDGLVDLVGPD